MRKFHISNFYNNLTLNIFSDASILKIKDDYSGCYGVVAVNKDSIIDSCYRIVYPTTNNDSELKGIRAAINLAYKYIDSYKSINIFSDSQISVFGLKRYIYGWSYNEDDGLLYTKAGKPAANQNVFVECIRLLEGLKNVPCLISLYHQAGHIDNNINSLSNASKIFMRSNGTNSVDINLIRYISTYNNYVDHTSRKLLHNTELKQEYYDPVIFYPNSKIKNNIF